jgi:hypothetical protein
VEVQKSTREVEVVENDMKEERVIMKKDGVVIEKEATEEDVEKEVVTEVEVIIVEEVVKIKIMMVSLK